MGSMYQEADICDENNGIIPRFIFDIFERLESRISTHDYKVFVSFLEIYNEELVDLLNPSSAKRVVQVPLTIVEDPKEGIKVNGLTKV